MELTLSQRIETLKALFRKLEQTSSRNEKEACIKKARSFSEQMNKDITYAFEVLDGRHKLGYTMFYIEKSEDMHEPNQSISLQEYVKPLFAPKFEGDLSERRIYKACQEVSYYGTFIVNLMNRNFRLGIGNSQLAKSVTSPMLAKKLDESTYDKLNKQDIYYLTEKLDGNRCIAYHDGAEWKFMSRSGKPMYVQFDMSQFPTSMVFDGEVMSRKQTEASIDRTRPKTFNQESGRVPLSKDFSEASGLINQHSYNKDLVYNIFDIVDNFSTYQQRRSLLMQFHNTENIRILPVIDIVTHEELFDKASKYLSYITTNGGEGIMVNAGHAKYQQKRTNDLLKFKKVYTLDMYVSDIQFGTGKFEGLVGALQCSIIKDGKTIITSVGSGLDEYQRTLWAAHPELIVGKIVEVAYFSLSQDKASMGTNVYSLRFPRLVRVRLDKDLTSDY